MATTAADSSTEALAKAERKRDPSTGSGSPLDSARGDQMWEMSFLVLVIGLGWQLSSDQVDAQLDHAAELEKPILLLTLPGAGEIPARWTRRAARIERIRTPEGADAAIGRFARARERAK